MARCQVWWVYVLHSESLSRHYVGSSTDPERRVRQHNGYIKRGARCTRAGRPWTLVTTYGPYDSRSDAFKAEKVLKRTRRGHNRRTWTPQDSPWCKIKT